MKRSQNCRTDDQWYQVIANNRVGGATCEIKHQRKKNDIQQQIGKELILTHGPVRTKSQENQDIDNRQHRQNQEQRHRRKVDRAIKMKPERDR